MQEQDFRTKNETICKLLIDNQPIIPENQDFFKQNMPEAVKFSDELFEKINELINLCEELTGEKHLKQKSELHELISDALYESERFHFVFGYKIGAKMMMELLNN